MKKVIAALIEDTGFTLIDVGDLLSPGAKAKEPGQALYNVPLTLSSLTQIANGMTDNLLSRAADVILKERRRLVRITRETPLHAGHLTNMLAVTNMDGIIAPSVPACYTRPQTIDDIINQTVGRVLHLFDIETDSVQGWGEDTTPRLSAANPPRLRSDLEENKQ